LRVSKSSLPISVRFPSLYLYCLDLWGLDKDGNFQKLIKSSSGSPSSSRITRLKENLYRYLLDTSPETEKDVGDIILSDLENIEKSLKKEKELFQKEQFTEREKNKRLLFLFQRDLMPGINGLILDAQDKRNELRIPKRSMRVKLISWSLLVTINTGMLFYILLFALSQDSHHQKAWGQSFAIWLVMDIFLMASLTVLFTNVWLPSWTMKEVGMIKQKLIGNLIHFYKDVAHEEDNSYWKGKKKNKKSRLFNCAEYLFLSYRLAVSYSDSKIGKLILSFQTPWPKQSYQYLSQDVSQVYSMKYSMIERSMSIIVLFFLTSFLSVPIAIQDMIVQMASTVTLGYTFLLHLRLYQIFPVLVIIPTIFFGLVIHFMIKAANAKKKMEETKLLNEIRKSQQKGKSGATGEGAEDDDDDDEDEEEQSDQSDDLSDLEKSPVQGTKKHINRRQSIQQGKDIISKAENFLSHHKSIVVVPKRRTNIYGLPDEFSFTSSSNSYQLSESDSDKSSSHHSQSLSEVISLLSLDSADSDSNKPTYQRKKQFIYSIKDQKNEINLSAMEIPDSLRHFRRLGALDTAYNYGDDFHEGEGEEENHDDEDDDSDELFNLHLEKGFLKQRKAYKNTNNNNNNNNNYKKNNGVNIFGSKKTDQEKQEEEKHSSDYNFNGSNRYSSEISKNYNDKNKDKDKDHNNSNSLISEVLSSFHPESMKKGTLLLQTRKTEARMGSFYNSFQRADSYRKDDKAEEDEEDDDDLDDFDLLSEEEDDNPKEMGIIERSAAENHSLAVAFRNNYNNNNNNNNHSHGTSNLLLQNRRPINESKTGDDDYDQSLRRPSFEKLN
jgi:hypothetical protein